MSDSFWTDQKVADLTKLWADGLSATQIAAEFGNVTRNTIIGKVTRLGLERRGKPASNRRHPPQHWPQEHLDTLKKLWLDNHLSDKAIAAYFNQNHPREKRYTPSEISGRRAQMGLDKSQKTFRATVAKPGNGSRNFVPVQTGIQKPTPVVDTQPEDVVIPLSERVTIMELREYMCRWPVGDPAKRDTFRYCGARSKTGLSYCSAHARIAYQPAADRRRDKKQAKG